jgi:hypothetical protein
MSVRIGTRPYRRGVTQLMYVGDDEAPPCDPGSDVGCPNEHAITMCKVGLGIAAAGLLTGKKTVRNAGLGIAALMFIAI